MKRATSTNVYFLNSRNGQHTDAPQLPLGSDHSRVDGADTSTVCKCLSLAAVTAAPRASSLVASIRSAIGSDSRGLVSRLAFVLPSVVGGSTCWGCGYAYCKDDRNSLKRLRTMDDVADFACSMLLMVGAAAFCSEFLIS